MKPVNPTPPFQALRRSSVGRRIGTSGGSGPKFGLSARLPLGRHVSIVRSREARLLCRGSRPSLMRQSIKAKLVPARPYHARELPPPQSADDDTRLRFRLRMGPVFQSHWFVSQFRSLPYPAHSFAGRTIIVTGANTGLGFDAAKHFVRLGAARVILACRSQARGDDAAARIARDTGRSGVAVAWVLDLAKYDSVRAFARRCAAELPRLDALVENAGVTTPARAASPVGDTEMTMAVNVYGTFLLLGLLLPKLRADAAARAPGTAARPPVVAMVTSEAHHFASLAEGAWDDVFAWLDDERSFDASTRYFETKLVQVYAARALAGRMKLAAKADADGTEDSVVLNLVNPGMCRTEFGSDQQGLGAWVLGMMQAALGRTSEVGSRTLVAGAAAGPESHGGYMTDCEVTDRAVSRAVRSDEGRVMQEKIWAQLKRRLQVIESGIFDDC